MNRVGPLVSVVIPTFNRGLDLPHAIESVRAQTMDDHEVIVCDDGSTDETHEVVESLRRRDSRVQYSYGRPSGRPSVPRNRGIGLARGEWVAFLDSDDRWAPNKLAVQLEALCNSHAIACCTNAFRVLEWPSQTHPELLERGVSHPTQASLVRRNSVITSSVVASREWLVRSGGFPEARSLAAVEDYALWLRLARSGSWIYLDVPLTYYRDAPSASIRSRAPTASSTKYL